MSLYDKKMPSLRDKIVGLAQQNVPIDKVIDEEVEVDEEVEEDIDGVKTKVVKKVKKGRRLNK